ncbi:nucleotidyltransferase family protein [Arcticibacter eurypsychrophilus]|uniref:nucleotidyltransferase family protein n=1 Tax=Arcticibacter eurypsychrophilus TaxID=1434752 RepID=UPI00084DB3B8|nr:nucleotidyltransferase family protein [Arcticibacter eurypsychrophilus]
MMDTGILILAAGSSSRLGRPKQLLPYQDKTLLQHITDEAIKANLHPIILITGAFSDEIAAPILQKEIEIIHNDQWQQGMASSIVAGLSHLILLNSDIKGVIIAVCDQPFITAYLLLNLIKMKTDSGKGIVACSYSNTIGTPVLFDHHYFNALLQLTGEEGAKKLVKQNEHDVATIPFPKGDIDIDTEEDYALFRTTASINPLI